ncbi:MAG: hypothetical protein IJT06_00875 [Selenomonadaceae bacterium]|nr:hypothetical protein [Selenomonadaceae bacterium]
MPRIYNADGTFEEVEHINWYLLAGPDIYAESRSTPICPVPKMFFGNQPNDGGNLILSEYERDELIKKNPPAEKYVRQLLGAEEFIHNKKRFCLWLVDCPPEDFKKMPLVYERIKKVREVRLKSKRAETRKLADVPYLFGFISQPKTNYILVPSVSSEKRKYIPMGFVSPEIICTNLNLMIPDAEVWHFGILTSSVHMIWTKTVCGRLESRYRYSAKIVYNNFVWAQMSEKDLAALKNSAQKILDVRKNYPNASLADLYDEITMPKDLRAAHRANDKVVMKIYGYDENMTEDCNSQK